MTERALFDALVATPTAQLYGVALRAFTVATVTVRRAPEAERERLMPLYYDAQGREIQARIERLRAAVETTPEHAAMREFYKGDAGKLDEMMNSLAVRLVANAPCA